MHLAGRLIDLAPIQSLARGAHVIADSCHALGGTLKGRSPAQDADMACYSFHPVKTMTTGEGGMVTCHDMGAAERLKLYRSHGIVRSPFDIAHYDMVDLGYNYRMPDILCALGLTQLAKASTVTTVSTNGAGVGQIVGVQVSDDGFITATFDNGEIRKLAKIPVATFPNPDGLHSLSGNAYGASVSAGSFSLKSPGEGGAGNISGSALEASTVDLSSEFSGLITTQRAYSASSKIILTADQMMQELLDIKR